MTLSRSTFNKLRVFEKLRSTNDTAISMAEEGAAEGTIVKAERQTHGRGRLGRSWVSPKGNLYCSIIVRPAVKRAQVAQLSLVVGISIYDALIELLPKANKDILLKWPNDVLVKNKKIAGLLLEASPMLGADEIKWVVIGLGLNVVEVPQQVENATSLRSEGCNSDADGVLKVVSRTLEAQYRFWQVNGFSDIRKRWLANAHPPGTKLGVRVCNQLTNGSFKGLTADGGLRLDVEGEGERIVFGGDICIVD